MMAKHIPSKNEIRIYTVNPLTSEAGQSGLLSSESKILRSNSLRVPKMQICPFDEDTHMAKVEITGAKENRNFTIKCRYCTYCAKTSNYFCQSDKCLEFQQELGNYTLVSYHLIPRNDSDLVTKSTSFTHNHF
jgi:hypothetical protein